MCRILSLVDIGNIAVIMLSNSYANWYWITIFFCRQWLYHHNNFIVMCRLSDQDMTILLVSKQSIFLNSHSIFTNLIDIGYIPVIVYFICEIEIVDIGSLLRLSVPYRRAYHFFSILIRTGTGVFRCIVSDLSIFLKILNYIYIKY